MWQGKRVSVVLPAYNEEQSIRRAVQDFYGTGVVDEVLVVDNNSTDRTVQEVQQTAGRLVREPTQGYGAALRRGLQEATGDLIVLAEPDGTFVSSDVLKLLAYADDFDMVCGTRTTKELIWHEANMGWFLRIGNIVVAKLLEFLFNAPSLSDCGCTMRLVRRDALQRFLPQLTVTGSHFLPEMVILARRADVSMIEIPVNYRGRKGVSKITGSLAGTLKTGTNMVRLILRYRFRRLAPEVQWQTATQQAVAAEPLERRPLSVEAAAAVSRLKPLGTRAASARQHADRDEVAGSRHGSAAGDAQGSSPIEPR